MCGLKCCTQALGDLTCFVQILFVKGHIIYKIQGFQNTKTHTHYTILSISRLKRITPLQFKKDTKGKLFDQGSRKMKTV